MDWLGGGGTKGGELYGVQGERESSVSLASVSFTVKTISYMYSYQETR